MSGLTLAVIAVVCLIISMMITIYWIADDRENAVFYVTIDILFTSVIMIVFMLVY